MKVDTDMLWAKIQKFENEQDPNWETCSIRLLDLHEKQALERRRIITDFERLCEQFL